MRKSGTYYGQVKAIEAHGPATTYCLPATKLILGRNILARLNGWWELAFCFSKLELSLALAFCGRSQDIPVVLYLCAS